MAGSYRHITDSDNNFIGLSLIDNLGDAYEALEECYLMIKHLSGNDKEKIYEAWRDGVLAKTSEAKNSMFDSDFFWRD